MIALLYLSLYRIFEKAGEKGWKAFIPFYNLYTYVKVAGYEGMSFLLMLVPILNVFYYWSVNIKMAKRFGHSGAFGFFMSFFPYLYMLILSFGDNTYQPAEKRPEYVADKQPLREKSSTSNVFVDENGDHVQRIRLEDW
ncbi:MAG: DUF5684 domain-containing protein [Bacteroidota bacterium]